MIPATRSDNLRGAALMVGSMAAFVLNDACLKYAAQDVPLFQTVFLRGLLVCALLAALAGWKGALRPIPRDQWGRVLARAVAEACVFIPFVIALTNMPLVNLTAIMQALPLTVTLAGALILKEAVGWRRWCAICVGFIGVLMIVQPGLSGFNAYALLGLLAVAAVTARDILTRGLSAEVPSLLVSVVTAVGICLIGAVGSLFEAWEPVSAREGAVIAGAAVFILFGYLFSVMVMRVGEIGFVTPFRYSALIFGLIVGWAVFDEWPNDLAMIGSGVVVATGLYTLWRERAMGDT